MYQVNNINLLSIDFKFKSQLDNLIMHMHNNDQCMQLVYPAPVSYRYSIQNYYGDQVNMMGLRQDCMQWWNWGILCNIHSMIILL